MDKPAFAAAVNVGSALPSTADTSLTNPTNQVTVATAGANGMKISAIDVQGVGTTVAGVVNIFRHDGSTYHLVDQFVITAVTSSTTAAAYRNSRKYEDLTLNANDTLRASQTVAGNASLLKVNAYGANF